MNKQTRRKWWVTGILFGIAVLIKIVALNSWLIENYYSQYSYRFISQFLRILFGWIPFSIGDILYGAVVVWLLFRVTSLLKKILKRQYSKQYFFNDLYKIIRFILIVYILFNVFWGLNYDRKGVAYVLKLSVNDEQKEDLYSLTNSLLYKVNSTRKELPAQAFVLPGYNYYSGAVAAYRNLYQQQPVFNYRYHSVKSSLFSLLGNYLGYSGYYNPFTAEAQVNVRMPSFLLPYVTCHEMAHQLGFASEDEANFVGYLAAKSSGDARFRYSVYFDLFNYANGELYLYDSLQARRNYKQLDTLVKKDILSYRRFLKQYENPLEPLITAMYGNYLKANNQPEGIKTYSRVTALLIAYEKKYKQL